MAFPTPKVYIAFDDGPYVASPTWTDVSSYVFSANVNRGRANDYANVVGTAFVVLNNDSRLFDPWNTAGTYYGKLLPRRQIKIEGVSGATTYPVFRGYIAAFPAQFANAGKSGTVSLQCFDALALLAQEQMPEALDLFTRSLNPFAYYKLNDPQGSTLFTDSIGGNSMLASGVSTFNSRPPLSANLIGTSAFLPHSGAFINTSQTKTSTQASIAFWVSPQGVIQTGPFFTLGGIDISVDVSPVGATEPEQRLQVEFWNGTAIVGTGTIYVVKTPVNSLPRNQANHVAITFDQTGVLWKIYINGILQTTTNTTRSDFIGGTTTQLSLDSTAQYQELSLYDDILSQAEVTGLFNGASNVYVETTAARVARILDYTSFPSALESITTTPVATVSNISLGGENLAAELALVNNAEGGLLYSSRNGTLTFTDRNFVYSNTKSNTSQATFATASIPYEPQVSLQYSGDQIRNVYQVSYSGGGNVTSTNTASVTAYGRNATTLETQLSTVAQASTLAAYEAAVGGQLLSTISPVSVGVTAATSDWSTLLGLELFERYAITVNPSTGSSFSQTQLVNQISHNIVPGQWKMRVDGSARYSSWFIINSSLLGGADLLQ
jgi:hypothetical protein